MARQHINPAGVSAPTSYTHVVAAEGRRIVFISGQVAINPKGEIVGEGDLSKQAEQVFENLKTCLASAGATFADVTKMTTFIVNYKPEDRPVLGGVRARYLPAENPPASTLVGVQALARPEIMIEIEATAVLP
jgi:enamine deaminase RidA (YjgF/YER057c/UK114 family)